jgi:hypothetical protein
MIKNNKKGFIQVLLSPAILLIIIIVGGFLYLYSQDMIPFLTEDYFQKIDMPTNISRNEDIKIEFEIINDGKHIIKPELEIVYDRDKWKTYNRYIKSDERIELDQLFSEQITTYSIEFDSKRYDNGEEIYNFTFNLYEGDELLDSEVKNVQIKE